MRVLGIDTSTRAASLALLDNGRVAGSRSTPTSARHSRTLLGSIREVFESAGLALSDLDGLAVASGPGSFTGLRIGIATANGLGLALGLPVLGVPSLEVMAEAARPRVGESRRVVCLRDARRGQVFAGAYELQGEAAVALGPPAVSELERVMSSLSGRSDRLVAGDLEGWIVEQVRRDGRAVVVEAGELAAATARIGALRLGRGQATREASPLYLRSTDAEICLRG